MTPEDVHKAAQTAQQTANEAWSRLHTTVAQALADGESATDLARRLGVSRGRVYQWRDKAR